MELANRIVQTAINLGFDGCGIVPLSKLDGYAAKLEERIKAVPESEGFYARQKRLIDPRQQFPWAKSVVVVAEGYGNYRVPAELRGRIARHYLFDSRIDERTKEFRAGRELEAVFAGQGLQFAIDRKFGLVGLRWAAQQAGVGLVRKNNFLYTKNGSWLALQAWLIGAELELVQEPDLPPCAPDCDRCQKACPTRALSAPYRLSPTNCVSFLTTFGGRDLVDDPRRKRFGSWLYGCDLCQEACPHNRDKATEQDEFPGLTALAPQLRPETLLSMDEETYRREVQPKFFYLGIDELWKWKLNVLCFFDNRYREEYRSSLLRACNDDDPRVRELAQAIVSERRPARGAG